MTKINFKNIALIVGVSVFDICMGLYDRLVNGIGLINTAMGPASPLQGAIIQPMGGTAATAGNIGLVIIVVVIAYIVFMLIGLGGVGGMGGKR